MSITKNGTQKSKQALLDELKSNIVASDVTPELKSQATQVVFGAGNPDADLVFIGEAPGKKEDETGEPFVGAAGKFLDEMLASIELERKDIYITNIVKYRPPNNRDPLPEEKEAFLPFLQAQLEIIKPKVVVTLGRHSGSCFMPDLHISSNHGQPKRVRVKRYEISDKSWGTMELVFLPLYHPAAALYNGGMRQTLIDDFALIPEVIKKINEVKE